MKKKYSSYIFYLEDMNQAMERIATYIHGYSFIEFCNDQKTIDAVIRNFEIIGEATNLIIFCAAGRGQE